MAQQKSAPPATPADEPRRGFLMKAAATLIGGLITLVPTALGAVFLGHPLRRKPASTAGAATTGNDGFFKVGSLASLTKDGPPQLFQVSGNKQDAWTTYPRTELGAVYVRLLEDGSSQGKPSCFNARCPHLGCTVNYQLAEQHFLCPCHDSSFKLDGERNNEIPPRSMDPLPIEIRNGNEVWVKFQNFRAGQAERIPIA